jgi:hypothetical protein
VPTNAPGCEKKKKAEPPEPTEQSVLFVAVAMRPISRSQNTPPVAQDWDGIALHWKKVHSERPQSTSILSDGEMMKSDIPCSARQEWKHVVPMVLVLEAK